jgi:hypothetical protein
MAKGGKQQKQDIVQCTHNNGKKEGNYTNIRTVVKISGFLGPKWHSPFGSMPFHKTQKTLDFQGPTPSHLPM